MARIPDIFADLRSRNQRALMPFVCGGHPAPGATAEVLPRLQAAGASIIEVGIPFSDPIADGPVIAAAMHSALQKGSTPRSVLDEVAAVRGSLSVGLVAMVSVSIVQRMGGPRAFVADAKAAGFDGFIFPDAPFEESRDYLEAANAQGLTASLMVAPTTSPQRLVPIVKACTGFIYLLSRTGITGERQDAPEIESRVKLIRQHTDLPIACGFGIGTAQHVRAVVRHADAAIVGSALVRRIDEAATQGRDPAAEAEAFTRELAAGLSG
jgi:tryptophan synthase alpha chain